MARKTSQTIGATAPPDLDGGGLDPYEGGDLERGFAVADAVVPGYLDLGATEAEFGVFERVRFEGTPFTGAHLRGVRMIDVELRGSDVSNANLAESRLARTVFVDCRMTGVRLSDADIEDVVFRGCKLDFANFRMAKLTQVTFEDCVLDDTEFNQGQIGLTRFERSKLERCDFTATRMRDVDMRGSEIVLRGSATDLGGAIVSPLQLMELAEPLARDAGIRVADGD